jgi:transposase, IS605 orfB family
MAEYIATRTYYSKVLDEASFSELTLIAKKLGILRKILWHQFSSNPKKLNDRGIRDNWLKAKANGTKGYPKIIDELPARLWKETLRDTIGNINAYFEAGFTEAIKVLYKKYGKEKGKALAKQLKTDYKINNELHRLIRKLIPKGYSNVDNVICLDEDCYSFEDDQTNIMQVMGLHLRKRLSIPLTTKNRPKGNFKIILKEGRCELRVSNKHQVVTDLLPKAKEAIGVDKGYSEVFTDNTGERYGNGFGKLLTKKSDFLDEKYKNRNKLWAIMKKAKEAGDIKRANNIKFNNLGNKKLNRQKEIMKAELKERIYSAAKKVAQKASIIAIEDLTFQSKKKTKFKKVNRRLSSWIKGVIDEAIIKYCFIYGTKLVYVNAAYTSQGDSRFNCALMGTRIGDSFIGFDEVVLDADINAAINILARLYDSEINLYTSAEKVKEILTKRANAVLSASVETAQLGLQQVVPVNLELPAKSGLSKRLSKNLTKVG